MTAGLVACLDIGSTCTKAALVDVTTGELVTSAVGPTTVATDVLDGVSSVIERLGRRPDEIRACSSAGGGLRLAVVGYEAVVTAEAGRRAALSAGSRVVHVAAGRLARDDVAALGAAAPDVVLLCGGTDGGDREVLLHNAGVLGRSRVRGPYVVAGNVEAQAEALALLGRRTAVGVANVLPEIGRYEPGPARAAVRELFVTHVIGGKGLTRRPAQLRKLVRGATPDAVLAGVELLADVVGGDVLAVDVGGATTDVCSVLDAAPDAESVRGADVAGEAAVLRTVEGDLGVRWSAPLVLEAAARERLAPELTGSRAGGRPAALGWAAEAQARHDEPALLPTSPDGAAVDHELGRLAVTVALRRHARTTAGPAADDRRGGGPAGAGADSRGSLGGGRDLRRVALVVGAGGVLRYADPAARTAILAPATDDLAGGWRLPERPAVVVDEHAVLAAAGLLAPDHPGAARTLLERVLVPRED